MAFTNFLTKFLALLLFVFLTQNHQCDAWPFSSGRHILNKKRPFPHPTDACGGCAHHEVCKGIEETVCNDKTDTVCQDVQVCKHNPMAPGPVCHNQKVDKCTDVPRQHCVDIKDNQCKKIPKNECKTIKETKCHTIDEQVIYFIFKINLIEN